MKSMKKIIFFFFVYLVIVINPLNVSALDSFDKTNYSNLNSSYNYSLDKMGNGEYAITKYDINIKVNENNTFNIEENIQAYFYIEKHGIFRKIPLKNTIKRLDQTVSNNKANVSQIEVNDMFSNYVENNYKVIKIGDPNLTLTGYNDYNISYLYNIGKDTGKGYDEFYFNLIGDEWDTTISDITFTIEMPKEFDTSKLGFSHGSHGKVDSSNVEYTVEGNIIKGSYKGLLSDYEALTIRLELPEGYFVGARINFNIITFLTFIIPIIFILISLYILKKVGINQKVYETVEFYPPKELNSAEVGLLYRGRANSNHVVSLLIYLANKGFLRIDEVKKKNLFFTKKDFIITRLKPYAGNNRNEHLFFKKLFSSKNEEKDSLHEVLVLFELKRKNKKEKTDNNVVTIKDLKRTFYKTVNRIVKDLNKPKNINIIFEEKPVKYEISFISMVLSTFFIMMFKPLGENLGYDQAIGFCFFIGIWFFVFLGYFIVSKNKIIDFLKNPFRNFPLLFLFTCFILTWVFMIMPSIMINNEYKIVHIIGWIAIIIISITNSLLLKRTKYGNEMLGKIKGFRNFLITAEKEKLEELVLEDPTYFYDILPYAYVLGVSNKYIKKFESISQESPNWYSGSVTSFGSFMSSTMSSFQNSVTSSSMSSGSGDGSSGGGSSSGGSGGGGGGSW